MLNRQTEILLGEKLRSRRKELLDHLELNAEAWTELQQRQIEYEESATGDALAMPLEGLEEQIVAELNRIDKALRKIELLRYGTCEQCGRQIDVKRLQVNPDAEKCISCASGRMEPVTEETEEAEPSVDEGRLPPELSGLDDRELADRLFDRIRLALGNSAEELEVEHHNGVIVLQGFLPSDKVRQNLLQFLHDTLGIRNIEDHTKTDPLLWQNQERTPGQEISDSGVYKTVAEGQGEEPPDDVESRKSGLPMEPADELIPERRR